MPGLRPTCAQGQTELRKVPAEAPKQDACADGVPGAKALRRVSRVGARHSVVPQGIRVELQRCVALLKRAMSEHGPPWKDVAEAKACAMRALEKISVPSKSEDK